MSKRMLLWHLAAISTSILLVLWWIAQLHSTQSNDAYPNRPIQVVVPYAAGGGSDTFVRILQKGIAANALLNQPLVIINQPGGSGTIGSREVKNAQPDGYKILCHHNAIITAKLAETVSFGPEVFDPIALTGEMSMVILVRGDAPFQDITDLLEQARVTPKAVRFGANKGAPAYFTTLQLEQSWPGADFSIVSAGGGADRYAKILGGHLEAGIFSLSEYLDFRGGEGTPPEQDVRAIAVLSPERHESIPGVPTAVERGVPVVLSNANYWWAPQGTPPPILDKLASVLELAMQDETVRGELRRLRMEPTFERGESFKRHLQETVRQFQQVVSQKPAKLPNFTLHAGLIVTALMIWVWSERWWQKRSSENADVGEPAGSFHDEEFSKRPGIALASFAALSGYVVALGAGSLPYPVATAAMVVVVGGLMRRAQKVQWLVLFELAVLTALGTQFAFTQLFVVPLP